MKCLSLRLSTAENKDGFIYLVVEFLFVCLFVVVVYFFTIVT